MHWQHSALSHTQCRHALWEEQQYVSRLQCCNILHPTVLPASRQDPPLGALLSHTHTPTRCTHNEGQLNALHYTEYAIAALHLEMDRVLGFAHLVHMAVHARTTVAKVDPLWVPLCTGAVGEVVWDGQEPARIQTLLSVACKGYCCLLVLGCCRMYCCMLARETSSSLFTQLQHEHTNTVSPRKACAGHCETK